MFIVYLFIVCIDFTHSMHINSRIEWQNVWMERLYPKPLSCDFHCERLIVVLKKWRIEFGNKIGKSGGAKGNYETETSALY